ncbi:hypothetical protein ABAC402_04740 [Asticcacaulis sp. AC402]|nr:hypothetical protein ABAC402_04740 [Asticcacaulis sp. AC402]
MEEILASIRRIISEDDAPEAEKPAPVAAAPEPEPEPVFEPIVDPEPEEDVLELTDTYDAPSSVSIGDIEAYEPIKPTPAPAPKPVYKAEPRMESLVSERTESSAASAFGSLSSSLLVPHSDRTLEDLTKDLLRPLLQQWLDAHLPAIVEEAVRTEVERIARQGRR